MKIETLIIPNLDNNGSSNDAEITEAITACVDMNGGATSWEAKGYWKSEKSGKLYNEAVTIIQSSTEAETDTFISDLANDVLNATDQEAVYYSFDGKPKIIFK